MRDGALAGSNLRKLTTTTPPPPPACALKYNGTSGLFEDDVTCSTDYACVPASLPLASDLKDGMSYSGTCKSKGGYASACQLKKKIFNQNRRRGLEETDSGVEGTVVTTEVDQYSLIATSENMAVCQTDLFCVIPEIFGESIQFSTDLTLYSGKCKMQGEEGDHCQLRYSKDKQKMEVCTHNFPSCESGLVCVPTVDTDNPEDQKIYAGQCSPKCSWPPIKPPTCQHDVKIVKRDKDEKPIDQVSEFPGIPINIIAQNGSTVEFQITNPWNWPGFFWVQYFDPVEKQYTCVDTCNAKVYTAHCMKSKPIAIIEVWIETGIEGDNAEFSECCYIEEEEDELKSDGRKLTQHLFFPRRLDPATPKYANKHFWEGTYEIWCTSQCTCYDPYNYYFTQGFTNWNLTLDTSVAATIVCGVNSPPIRAGQDKTCDCYASLDAGNFTNTIIRKFPEHVGGSCLSFYYQFDCADAFYPDSAVLKVLDDKNTTLFSRAFQCKNGQTGFTPWTLAYVNIPSGDALAIFEGFSTNGGKSTAYKSAIDLASFNYQQGPCAR